LGQPKGPLPKSQSKSIWLSSLDGRVGDYVGDYAGGVAHSIWSLANSLEPPKSVKRWLFVVCFFRPPIKVAPFSSLRFVAR
jgi:hypothetical protein